MPVSQLDDHSTALWLIANLERQEPTGNGGLRGLLPAQFSFKEVAEALDRWNRLGGICDSSDRSIEFYPASAHVYETLDQMLALHGNSEASPERFTIQDIAYSSGVGGQEPLIVRAYRAAVKLAQAIKRVADVDFPDGDVLFVKSHDERLRLQMAYSSADLSELRDMDDFLSTFFDSDHHRDQKRAVVRQSILGLFKGTGKAKFGELLRRAQEFETAVRSAYAMYMAEFTFEKVRAEVEKDNLDSALKLGKAVSEIQNQLLAMPVALLLVGGQMERVDEFSAKNYGLLSGAIVFAWLMDILVRNQASSLSSIDTEISMRKAKVEKQSSDIAAKFRASFDSLTDRLKEQRRTLRKLRALVAVGLLFSVCFFAWSSSDNTRSLLSDGIEFVFRCVYGVVNHVAACLGYI